MMKEKLFNENELDEFFKSKEYFYDTMNELERPKNRLIRGQIVGHALEIRNFVRYFMIFLHTKKIPLHTPAYHACLLLNDIINLILAPKISTHQASHFHVLYDEYMNIRALVTDDPGISKHHLLRHIPLQVRIFG